MHWLDVAGPPGVGKSTLCDPLWGPHEVPILDELPPFDWQPFVDEITRLLEIIRPHWSFVPAVRMNRRSVRKIGTVCRIGGVMYEKTGATKEGPYIQTALVQRGLGFGWRLHEMGKVEEVRRYFEVMPVSIGVAFLHADEDEVKARNLARTEVQETAHENRGFMVPLMAPAIEIAREVLDGRGVPVVEIDTRVSVGDARRQLVEFARREPFDPDADRSGREVEAVQPPVWW